MIFCGDTVLPFKFDEKIFKSLDKDFLVKEKIVNLESLIRLEDMQKTTKGIALESDKSVVDFLKILNVKSVSLANNHITDFDTSIDHQRKFLKQNGIDSFGAGDSLSVSAKPTFYTENGIDYGVISFGWEVISCKGATGSKKGVNPLVYENIIMQVKNFFREYKNIKLICMFHWDYEFELYPQPAHRQLAFELIDLGVSAIIGHHPHIVQGFEVYKNKPIFYSLGNFYFPDANYNGYEMKYSEEAKNGLCIELNEKVEETNLYWTYLSNNKDLLVTKEEKLFNSDKLKKLSPSSKIEHKEYIKWFRTNRIKNKGLPIYKTIDSKFEVVLNNSIVKYRQIFINFLVRLGIKK